MKNEVNNFLRFAFLYYALAICIVLFFTAIGVAVFQSDTGVTPFLLFFPAVIIMTIYAGLRVGIFTALFSGIMIGIFFFPVFLKQGEPNLIAILQILIFILEGALISYFIANGKRTKIVHEAKRREREYRERLEIIEKDLLKAEKEIHSRDEFLSIASHELKTPLTSMLLQTQTAIHNIRNVSLANFSIEHLLTMLGSVENQTKRLSRMINDLLNISLITTGNMQLEKEKIDAATIVNDVIADFDERLKRDNYKLEVTIEESRTGNWDPIRIEQAFSNLLANAIKYGQGKPISIKVDVSGNYQRISIEDQGIGIPKKDQKRIFELFERAVSPGGYKGLGVGLFITNRIIEAHEGRIQLDSHENDGSRFTMLLPLDQTSS